MSLQPHTIRFPKELHDDLKTIAEERERSFNSLIIIVMKNVTSAWRASKDAPAKTLEEAILPKQEKTIADLVQE